MFDLLNNFIVLVTMFPVFVTVYVIVTAIQEGE